MKFVIPYLLVFLKKSFKETHMKVSKILIAGIAGVAIAMVLRRLLRLSKHDFDDIFFDSDFLNDTKKPAFLLSENSEMTDWLRRPSSGEMFDRDSSVFT